MLENFKARQFFSLLKKNKTYLFGRCHTQGLLGCPGSPLMTRHPVGSNCTCTAGFRKAYILYMIIWQFHFKHSNSNKYAREFKLHIWIQIVTNFFSFLGKTFGEKEVKFILSIQWWWWIHKINKTNLNPWD